jgi:hypothetical protein
MALLRFHIPFHTPARECQAFFCARITRPLSETDRDDEMGSNKKITFLLQWGKANVPGESGCNYNSFLFPLLSPSHSYELIDLQH